MKAVQARRDRWWTSIGLPAWAARVVNAVGTLLRGLNSPAELLSEIRGALLVFSVGSAGVLLVVLTLETAGGPLRWLALVALTAVSIKWTLTFRLKSLSAAWDVLDGLALVLVAVATGSPLTVLMLLYVRVCYRAVESGPRRTIAIVAIYSMALVAALISDSPSRSSISLLFLLTGFPLCAIIMHALGTSLRRLDQSIQRERSLRQELQQESSESFRLLFSNNPHPMWIYDLETLAFLEVNRVAIDRYGYSHAEFATMTIKDIRPPEDVPALVADVKRPRTENERAANWRHRLRDGRDIVVEITSSRLQFGGREAVLVLAQDITDRTELDHQLRRQAFQDPLTGLANRALFRDRVEHALAQGQRSRSASAVFFIDLDNFKTINDSLGHSAGDLLLIEVATRLARCVRPGDTVTRLGGDEFAILLDEVSNEAAWRRVADRIRAELGAPFDLEADEWFVSASVGIAIAAAGESSPEEMLRNADTAMYSAKADGRGLCVLYEPSMHEAVLNRRALETDLRNAIAAGELTIAYQPEVDIRSGRIVGMEALSRWRHPIRGPLAPDVFIPLAEEAGLIDELDDLVLRSVTAQGRKWQLQGLGPIRLAVNVSARELSDSALLDRVTRALTDSGLDSSWLELEVTESAAANSAAAVEVLGRLSDLGVQIAIDDFGVGYSMLSRLQDFPLAKLKIDRAFIHEIQAATDRAPLVQGIIAMGHSLGLEIVAEGVELAAQLEFLEAHGCDQVQGYLIGRPAEASEAERLLQLSVVLDPARERARATPDPVISIAYSARSRRS